MYTAFVNNLSEPVNVGWSVGTSGKYLRHVDGAVETDSDYSVTDYVNISKYKYLTYSQVTVTSSDPSSGIAFYDSSKRFISGVRSAPNASQMDYQSSTTGVPKDAEYARFTVISSRSSEFSVTGYEELKVCIHDDVNIYKEMKLISPKLTLSDNAAGSFVFTMNSNSLGLDEITRMKSEISVERDGDEIWSGRVLTERKNYWNQREFTCEGELSYLNDILLPPAEYNSVAVSDFLTAVINEYNKKASIHRQFTIGEVDVESCIVVGEVYVWSTITTTTNYDRAFDVIKKILLDKYGGHLQVRKDGGIRYLDYHTSYNSISSQQITFQDNLMDFTSDWDESEMATVIIPYGAKLDEDTPETLSIDIQSGYMPRYRLNITTGSANAEEGWAISSFIDCHKYSSLEIANRGSSSQYNLFFRENLSVLSSFETPAGVVQVTVPDDAFYMQLSNDMESYFDMRIVATLKNSIGLTYKTTKTRYGNRYKVDFNFTFHNPGVPYYSYYVDGEEHFADFDYNVWLNYKRVGDADYISTSQSGMWTMHAGDAGDKTCTITVTGLSVYETYTWYAEVHQINVYTQTGTNQSMGPDYETGDHTFTAAFSDDKLDSDENRLTVGSVNDNDITVKNQNALDTYGRIEKVVVWDAVTDAEELLYTARRYLRDEQFDKMLIEIKSVDLHYLDPTFPAINLLDQVVAISEPHGMFRTFPVTKIEIPLDQPENTFFTLGDVKATTYTGGAVVRSK